MHGGMGGSWSSGAGPDGMRDVGTGCRQQPCGELHKLPIWQRSPAGEGRRGPAPAAIPSSFCRLGLLPQPSFLGKKVDGDSKWGNALAPPSPALPGGSRTGTGGPWRWLCPGSRVLSRADFPQGRLVLTVSV